MTGTTVKPAVPALPAYERVKRYVLHRIHNGEWQEGDAIPGEEALAREFGVSRMTVNRAIRELSDEQIVERVQGSGTYVAQQKYQATLVEIRNIAEEIAARALDKIIYVGSQTHPAIREQAEAFKDNIRQVLVHYMHEAVRSHNVTLVNKFKQAGHPELIPILDA